MSAMHDDTWVAEGGQPDPQADQLREVFAARDKRAADTGTVTEHWDSLVRQRVAAVERETAARNPTGRWQPDEWESKARAVIDYRDRIADSVADPVPAIGTPEWAAADWQTKTAAYARHERGVATARGPAISNSMAEESGRRRDLVESAGAMAAEWTRRGYGGQHLPYTECQRQPGEVGIPDPRRPAEWTPAPAGDAGTARVRG